MLAMIENPGSIIMVDGIGMIGSDGSRKAYYGHKDPFVYSQKSHTFDSIYLDIFVKTNQIKFN